MLTLRLSSALLRPHSRWVASRNDFLLWGRQINPIKHSLTRLSSSKPSQSSIVASIPASTYVGKGGSVSLSAGSPTWRKLVEKAKSDPGNLVMNAGAIMSLSGFMMSDVMHLRTLSVCGSFCGIAFNATRRPPQYNAVAWGMVFVSVNLYHLYHLYLERTEDMTFHHDEMMLYSTHFKDWGVEPWQFKKLVKLDRCRFRTFRRGDVIVKPNKPLDDILMVVRGEVAAENKDTPPLSQNPMYTYRGDGKNGCVVGGTALVDPVVRQRNYPNRLVSLVDDTVIVKWNTDELLNVMERDKDIESAMLHALYVELIQGLRRDRKMTEKVNKMSDSLLELERMIKKTLDNAREENEGGPIKLKSEDKKAVRVFASENKISASQRETVLWKLGWTPDEWDDGAKQAVTRQK